MLIRSGSPIWRWHARHVASGIERSSGGLSHNGLEQNEPTHGGLGFGLAMVRDLAELTAAASRAANDARGRGAILVALPAALMMPGAAVPFGRRAVHLKATRAVGADSIGWFVRQGGGDHVFEGEEGKSDGSPFV